MSVRFSGYEAAGQLVKQTGSPRSGLPHPYAETYRKLNAFASFMFSSFITALVSFQKFPILITSPFPYIFRPVTHRVNMMVVQVRITGDHFAVLIALILIFAELLRGSRQRAGSIQIQSRPCGHLCEYSTLPGPFAALLQSESIGIVIHDTFRFG